ncbi:hypothetical protein [Actinoplanes sp. L3-i22]|uniref:hypothetical protein n=1 Tax=Actinoplanes sp. L3-i22 TaxID=2836373 RepID=UPI001C8662ED|nr:hypothetical protein [Actinoplanes sp. L3-i22]
MPALPGLPLPGGERPAQPPAGPGILTLTWRRRLDFAELAFDLHNIRLDRSSARLVAVDGDEPSYVVVRFPTQSIAEQTSPDNPAVPDEPMRTRAAEPSRLAFEVTGALPCPATLDWLLDWNRWIPRVVPLATPRGPLVFPAGTLPRAPGDTETCLEIPYRLQLSPHHNAGWAHRVRPGTARDGWTELWHTRLGVREATAPGGVDESDPAGRTVRAVWARYEQMPAWIQAPPTLPPDPPDELPSPAMSAADRLGIVRRTCDPRPTWTLDRAPIDVNTLMLTSLGGWLISDASWPPPATDDPSVVGWQHRATLGRDHYVRVVDEGYLFPFGHRAALVTVSERKILQGGHGRRGYLRKREFIMILERERDYGADPETPAGGRAMPFTRLRAMLETTPDLGPDPKVFAGGRLVVAVDGTPVQFPWRGTDHGKGQADFQAPAFFVAGARPTGMGRRPAAAGAALSALSEWYDKADKKFRTAAVGGVPISVAPLSDDPAATRVVVHEMLLGGPASGDLPFPSVQSFQVELPHVAALSGASEAITSDYRYFSGYVNDGFKAPGEVFLAAVGTGPTLAVPAEATGVATPQMAIVGLSRSLGPVAGDVESAAKGLFDPSAVFTPDAKLLGDLTLHEVLAGLLPKQETPNPEQALKITTRDLPDGVETTMVWKPKLKSVSILQVDDGSTLELDIRMTARIGKPPTHDTRGTLSGVHLAFFAEKGPDLLLRVQVKTLRFTDSSGAKPDLHCDIGDVEFLGALAFVKELSSLIGFGKGNGVSIVPAGDRVTVALNVAVPSLAVGVLALSNITVHVGLVLPFDGTPVVFEASFATRENKFVIGVGILRGGGFAALSMSSQKLLSFEFALEFGAGVSIDLGVASGCVEMMAGIHFNIDNGDRGTTIALTAYMRLRGSVSVLGLITVTVEFYLGLTYNFDRNSLIGEATMTVSIDLFLFSTSVSITCRRELNRDSLPFGRQAPALTAEPVRFGDVFTPDLWAQHCAAFAPA